MSRCRSEPTAALDEESLMRFLRRQNLCEEARQTRLGRIEACESFEALKANFEATFNAF